MAASVSMATMTVASNGRSLGGTPHDAGGFGLGLPFARAVARAHGGDLATGDEQADRTAFVLTLPLIAWTDDAPAGPGA